MKGPLANPEGKSGSKSRALKSPQWFPAAAPPRQEPGVGSALLKLAIGAAVGAAFFAVGKRPFAFVVWGIAFVIGSVSLASARSRGAIDRVLATFGRWVGSATAALLLGGMYLLVLTPTRLVRRALGADDLHLRDRGRATYWLESDDEARKARWVDSMFATETRSEARGGGLRRALVITILMFGLAEGVLRTQGFGNTVLYVADPVVGYYPEPNKTLDRYGGRVHTNQYGMRSRDIPEHKAEGDFRVLLLGDSTLYGGSYIDQSELWATHLETELQAHAPAGRHVHVLAMGANGWGPFHEHGWITKFGTFDADVVMVTMPIDDINRPLYGLMDVPFFATNKPPTLALEEVLNHLMWRYRSAHSGLDEKWEAEQSVIGIREYGRLVDDLRRRVPEVFATILPTRSPGLGGPDGHREAAWSEKLLAEFGAHHTVAAYYAKGLFAGKGHPNEIYYDNVHLNPKGHAVYGKYLAEQLLKDSPRLQRWTRGEPIPTVAKQEGSQ